MMKEIKKRKTLRISEYNYSNEGLYFITICTKNRQCILSKIISNSNNTVELKLLPFGEIVRENIIKTNKIYNDIKIEDYIIMPNHIHFICNILENKPIQYNNSANSKLSLFISGFKRFINKDCRKEI